MVGVAKRASRAALYPETDHTGESLLQKLIIELLRPLLARFLAERAVRAAVGANQFVYWVQGQPTQRIAPDLFVLPGVSPDRAFRSWKTWEEGVVPTFALEIVSDDWRKDYEDGPTLYDGLGVAELVVFDPYADGRDGRVAWQVFRRVKRRGLVRVEHSAGDRVRVRTLGAFLRVVGSGDGTRLRVGTGAEGDALFATEAEAERAAKENERAARLNAEARVAELEAALRSVKRGPGIVRSGPRAKR